MSGNIFCVALLQKNSAGYNLELNTEVVVEAMAEAKQMGADILLLPECFVTGYSLPITNEEAIDDNSKCLWRICDNARALNIGVVVTALTKGTAKARNSALVVDKHGSIIMRYDKVHTCDFADEKCLEGGNEFKVCEFDEVKLGVMICYDREYPESARVLMLKGAEIILVPNDCAAMKPRLQALSVRAYENMVGISMANPPGKNRGNSCAFSPICWDENGICINNEILVADSESSGIFYADFNIKELRDYRNREMMGNTFRKVGAYSELMNGRVTRPFIRDI